MQLTHWEAQAPAAAPLTGSIINFLVEDSALLEPACSQAPSLKHPGFCLASQKNWEPSGSTIRTHRPLGLRKDTKTETEEDHP